MNRVGLSELDYAIIALVVVGTIMEIIFRLWFSGSFFALVVEIISAIVCGGLQ